MFSFRFALLGAFRLKYITRYKTVHRVYRDKLFAHTDYAAAALFQFGFFYDGKLFYFASVGVGGFFYFKRVYYAAGFGENVYFFRV